MGCKEDCCIGAIPFKCFNPTPSRGIWWPRAVLHQVTLTFCEPLGQADIQCDISPVEASGGQEQYYIMSAWYLMSLWPGWPAVRCQLDIWWAFGSGWHSVRHTPTSIGSWWPRVTLHNMNLTFGQHLSQVDWFMLGYIWCQQPG